MPGARRLIILGIALTLWSALAWGADSTATPVISGKPKKSTTAAVFMSMAVPGLGQFYTHSYVKAVAAVLIEGALGGSISYNNDRMLAAERSADNAFRTAQQRQAAGDASGYLQFKRIESNHRTFQHFFKNQRNRLIWWFAGTLALSMGDAYVDAQLYRLDFSPSLSLSGSSVGLTVACRF
jgi:hypothetical protein